LKVDKLVTDLFKKLHNSSNNGNGINGSSNYYNTNNNNHIKDDDYYLAIGSEPPRFAYYRHVRAEKWKALGHNPLIGEDYDHSIIQEELDFALKRKLWPSPEQRYQHEKSWLFHESSWYVRGLDGYDGQGCNQFTGCVEECRFYADQGRIEDEEVIAKHNEFVESLRQENAIVEPPSEGELLELAKIYHFS
jgi:hypothetical protein